MLSPELQQALALHRSGRLQEAETIYRRALAAEPADPAVPHLLGVLTAQTNRLAEGYDLLRKAADLQPRNAEVFSDLGSVAAMLGRADDAERWLKEAIAIAPNHVSAMANLAKVQQQRKRLAEAEACANTVLRAAPQRIDMHNVLALVRYQQHRFDEAEEICRKALSQAPNFADLHNTLGLVLRDMHRLEEAAAAFKRAGELLPNNPAPLHNLGICLHQLEAYAAAEQVFRKVLEAHPAYVEATYALGESIVSQGRTDEGRALLDAVIAGNPQHWMARWSRLLALPVIYDSEAQIEEVRADFDRQLTAFESDIAEPLTRDAQPLLHAARFKTPFLLHYQGREEIGFQSRFGALVTRIAEAGYPQHMNRAIGPGGAPGARLRVGFASSYLHNHSIGKMYAAWILGLPRDRFDVSAFHLQTHSDATTERLKQSVTWHACGTLSEEELVARIAGAQLDALIWLDIGMDQKAQIPAALRLAPVQATTLGHPLTTGLRNMDYVLSSDPMEPAGGESQYTERLVRLPNLSVTYPHPPVDLGQAPESLAALQQQGRILYLCAQSLYKLVPRNDDLFAALARDVPQAVLVFLRHQQAAATEIFSQRIHRAFAAAGVDPVERIHILPRLSQEDFFAVNRAADVVLDSLSWSGFNSTMEALACAKPVVTLPGRTMRSRHSFGILGRIGMTELIARDEKDYVAIAARLGTDRRWRDEIIGRIAARKDQLFDDPAPFEGFVNWLEGAVAAASGERSWTPNSSRH